jgi:hydroxyacylglutathione hydrolase
VEPAPKLRLSYIRYVDSRSALGFVTVPVGALQCNCYILWSDPADAVIIDPGDEPEKIVATLSARGLTPRLILNTHGHFDHTGAVEALRTKYGATYRIHEDEKQILRWIPAGTKMWGLTIPAAPVPTEFVADRQKFHHGELVVEAIHTPGHTPGSTCFYVADLKSVFTGDTLFAASIGRTDFPGGSMPQILDSIHERLLTLPPETKVFPGHGPATTVKDEAESNPFLQ